MSKENNVCYDVNDLYNILPLGRNQVYALVKSKDFPKIQVGKKFLIPKKLFDEWLIKQAT